MWGNNLKIWKGKKMKRKMFALVSILSVLVITAIMLTACARDKAPAEQALKAAEEAVNAIKVEAVKYVPDQVNSLESTLSGLKDKFAKGDYKAVITEAKALADQANQVAAAATAKKDELTKTWTEMSQGLPKMVEAIQSRVNILSKSKKLPSNLNAEKFEQVKTDLEAAKAEWTQALESYQTGMIVDSVAKAESVKAKAIEAMEILGLPVPAATQPQ
jgi:hypothetical protein